MRPHCPLWAVGPSLRYQNSSMPSAICAGSD
nr:MAG TPA: hypothetical protein [Caudoviricetes sp.]